MIAQPSEFGNPSALFNAAEKAPSAGKLPPSLALTV